MSGAVNEEALKRALAHYRLPEDDPKAREMVLKSTMYAYWNLRLACRALFEEATEPLARFLRRFLR